MSLLTSVKNYSKIIIEHEQRGHKMVIPKRYPIIRLVILGALIVSDTIITYILVTEGFAGELNPVVKLFIVWGWKYYFLMKFLVSLGFILFVLYTAHKKVKMSGLIATLALIIYASFVGGLMIYDLIVLP
ncbi:DUF5658 family protein [Patescibacteria group bacterium]